MQRYAYFPKELISVFRKILPLSKIYFILPYWRINHVQPPYWRNISAKIQKIFGKVMIWIDFIYQNGIEISLSFSFGDK